MDERPPARKTHSAVAIVAAGAVLVALYLGFQPDGPDGIVSPDLMSDAGADAPAQNGLRSELETASAAPTGVGEGQSAEPEFTPAAGRAPSFDIVRVDPGGSALVAGYAVPGSEVSILADGAALARAEADADGNFVAFFDAKPTGEPIALSMEATGDGAQTLASEDVVMIFPQDDAAVVAGEASSTETKIAATAIVRRDTIEVSSMVDQAEVVVADQVTLGSIAYSSEGQIELSGAGPMGAPFRVYIDNDLRAEGAIGTNGRWLARLDDVQQGLYQLRIDQLGADGQVASRVETPFQRDHPREPRPRPGASGASNASAGILATVQPGGTLWTISREHYGSGTHYALIFTANRGLIRDPNLIYPGQVLTIPGFD